MAQITISDMSFAYKTYYEPIFEHVTLNLDSDWWLGLIGRNGRGKSTLLRLLHGELIPDEGKIKTDRSMELFPYQLNTPYTRTIDVMKEGIGGLRTMEEHLEDMEILQQYLDLDGYTVESRIEKEMNRMELPLELLEQDYATLSGGERTKIMLIILFLRPNAFVLMDEPTNHLDIAGKQEVARYLMKKKGFIVVSHDRQFVDQVADHILSINKANITVENGNYSTFKKNQDMIEEYEARTYANLEHEIKSLEQRAGRERKWAEVGNEQKTTIGRGHGRTNGNRAYMRQAKRSEENILENIEEKKGLLLNYEKAEELVLTQKETEAERLLTVKNLSFSYSSRALISNLNLNIDRGDRIWIQGKNGAGKTTLLQLLAGDIMVEEKIEQEEIKIAKARQDALWKEGFLTDLYPPKQEGAERFYELCRVFGLPEGYQARPLETFSSGELKKVEIARALAEPADIIFMDEPLNYMDILFREQLEKAILTYEPTMVFVEHDQWFGEQIFTKKLFYKILKKNEEPIRL